jgi:hypothetical protein
VKAVNVPMMRAELGRIAGGTPLGQEAVVQFRVEDATNLIDEIEVGRKAAAEAGEVLDFARTVMKATLKLVVKPRNRLPLEQALAKIDALLEVPEEEKISPEEADRRRARSKLLGPDGRRLT